MKTAKYYSNLSLIALAFEAVGLFATFATPEPYDWFFIVLAVTAFAVAMWAIIKETKAKHREALAAQEDGK